MSYTTYPTISPLNICPVCSTRMKRLVCENCGYDFTIEYEVYPGSDTRDKVFLLSISEAEKYFASDDARKCKPTPYAEANGAYINSDTKCCWWWLRSPGNSSYNAACVDYFGSLDRDGDVVSYVNYVVCPALWINL